MHKARIARIPAADSRLQWGPEARWQMQDHVEMFAALAGVVLAKPNPPAPLDPPPAPRRDPVPNAGEEGIEIAFRSGVEVDWVEVERSPERASDEVSEVLCSDDIAPSGCRDALRLRLVAAVLAP
jgi:hypothetical protein